MLIHLFPNVTSVPAQSQQIPAGPGEILDWVHTLESLPCSTEADKLAGPGVVLAQYRDGAASKKYSELDPESKTKILCFDCDDLTPDGLQRLLDTLILFDATVYSTFKHCKNKPRVRVFLALDQEIPNFAPEPFNATYAAVAKTIGITVDTKADSRANLYFLPQHHVDHFGDCVRHRFNGAAFPVSTLVINPPDPKQIHDVVSVGQQPSKADLNALVKRLARRGRVGVSAALAAMIKKQTYAQPGNRHDVRVSVSASLVHEWPLFDEQWSLATYLGACHATMSDGDGDTDWVDCVKSAKIKFADEKNAETKNKNTPGRLCVHGNIFYLFDEQAQRYKGPYCGTTLATGIREVWNDGSEIEPTKNGARLKTPIELCHEFGQTVGNVVYTHSAPKTHIKGDGIESTLFTRAYDWTVWEPEFSTIADDLLRCVSGDAYPEVEKYFSQFRNLDVTLPALTLIGPPGTWKTTIAETLARFWTDPDHSRACAASQVMGRFAEPLLHNPLIISDEALAKNWQGLKLMEGYRQSITASVHPIEIKKGPVVYLHTKIRHVICANDRTKIFTDEVDSDTIRATMERFLVAESTVGVMAGFEARWAETAEMAELRKGGPLLRHIVWLEQNRQSQSDGRLFVKTHNPDDLLVAAKFASPEVALCCDLFLSAIVAQASTSNPGSNPHATPMFRTTDGVLRVSSRYTRDALAEGDILSKSRVALQSPVGIGRLLARIGLRQDKNEQIYERNFWGWAVDREVWDAYLRLDGHYSPAEFNVLCDKIWPIYNTQPISSY